MVINIRKRFETFINEEQNLLNEQINFVAELMEEIDRLRNDIYAIAVNCKLDSPTLERKIDSIQAIAESSFSMHEEKYKW